MSRRLLIVVNVVFFQEGIMGWVQRRWPERFGIVVDRGSGKAADATNPEGAR
jgi:branched-chain amino acid transport system permease protein